MANFLQSVNRMVDRAMGLMDLPPGLPEEIRTCHSIYRVSFHVPIRGEFRVFTGWRAVHNEWRLPVKGAVTRARWLRVPSAGPPATLAGSRPDPGGRS